MLCALAATAGSAQASAPVPVTIGNTQADLTFNKGKPGAPPDTSVTSHLVGLINREQVAIAANIFQINDPAVVNALYHAKVDRGVAVYITYDKPNTYDTADNTFWFVDRDKYRNCIYGCMQNAFPAKAHSKFFLFFRTRRSDADPAVRPATWLGSANPVTKDGGNESSNNAITYWDDPDLWWQMWSVWQDMKSGNSTGGDYYRPELGVNQGHSGLILAGNANTWVQVSPNTDTGYDMWTSAVSRDRINRSAWPCRLQVVVPEIHDGRLGPVNELRYLAAGGCRVDVTVDINNGAPQVSHDTACAMSSSGINLRARNGIHDKLATFNGTYDGTAGRSMVWTGSQNWTPPARFNNDELLVTIVDWQQQVYGYFFGHADTLWHDGNWINNWYAC
jgi:hypothetical protein